MNDHTVVERANFALLSGSELMEGPAFFLGVLAEDLEAIGGQSWAAPDSAGGKKYTSTFKQLSSASRVGRDAFPEGRKL